MQYNNFIFIPGKVIKNFKSKSGKEIILRYPRWEDLDLFLKFINDLSMEDVYITIGDGKEVIRKEEIKYLTDVFSKMEENNLVKIVAFYNEKLAGNCDMTRITKGNREYHVGVVGISLSAEFRNDGIGKAMLKTLINEARNKLNLKLLTLNVYSLNERALKLYESIGFKRGGLIPGAVMYKNQYIDKIEMYFPINK